MPVVDRIRTRVDMREQVASFPPQPVITEDNLVVSIDTVIYFQVTEPKAATYEINDFMLGIEQLTVTTLRNVIGSMDLEEALTSRRPDQRPAARRARRGHGQVGHPGQPRRAEGDRPAEDRSRRRWRSSCKAERERRARDPHGRGAEAGVDPDGRGAEAVADPLRRGRGPGQPCSAPMARPRRGSSRPRPRPRRSCRIYEGLRSADPQPNELAHRYLQAIPEVAKGDANKVWIIPAELTGALDRIRDGLSGPRP